MCHGLGLEVSTILCLLLVINLRWKKVNKKILQNCRMWTELLSVVPCVLVMQDDLYLKKNSLLIIMHLRQDCGIPFH